MNQTTFSLLFQRCCCQAVRPPVSSVTTWILSLHSTLENWTWAWKRLFETQAHWFVIGEEWSRNGWIACGNIFSRWIFTEKRQVQRKPLLKSVFWRASISSCYAVFFSQLNYLGVDPPYSKEDREYPIGRKVQYLDQRYHDTLQCPCSKGGMPIKSSCSSIPSFIKSVPVSSSPNRGSMPHWQRVILFCRRVTASEILSPSSGTRWRVSAKSAIKHGPVRSPISRLLYNQSKSSH